MMADAKANDDELLLFAQQPSFSSLFLRRCFRFPSSTDTFFHHLTRFSLDYLRLSSCVGNIGVPIKLLYEAEGMKVTAEVSP